MFFAFFNLQLALSKKNKMADYRSYLFDLGLFHLFYSFKNAKIVCYYRLFMREIDQTFFIRIAYTQLWLS